MGKKTDNRVRRLAGGAPHMNLGLSTAVGRALRAQVHYCHDYTIQAVLTGLANVYVEGVHYNPLANYAPWMPNGSIHAWCMKDGQLIDSTMNSYTLPGQEEFLRAYVFTPLAVLTRSGICRAYECGGDEAVDTLVRSMTYDIPAGVAPMTEGEVTLESMQAAIQQLPDRE